MLQASWVCKVNSRFIYFDTTVTSDVNKKPLWLRGMLQYDNTPGRGFKSPSGHCGHLAATMVHTMARPCPRWYMVRWCATWSSGARQPSPKEDRRTWKHHYTNITKISQAHASGVNYATTALRVAVSSGTSPRETPHGN